MRFFALAVLLVGCGPTETEPPRDSGPPPPPPGFRAAVATFDMTPEPGAEIVGFGIRTSTEVRDPLQGAVLILEREGTRVAFVTLDLPGIYEWHSQRLRSRISLAIAAGVENVIIAASHTHSAPLLSEDEWSDATRDAAERAARDAVSRLEPVRLSLGEDAIEFDVNRRLPVSGVAEARPNPDGPHDSRVRTLIVENDDGLVALLAHVVCHPNVLRGVESTRISADFPGEARDDLLARLGAPLLVMVGAAGDIRSLIVDDDGEFRLGDDADLERLGGELADAVERSLDDARGIDGELGVAREVFEAPNTDGMTTAVELSAVRIGTLALVTIPGEPMVEIGLSVEEALVATEPTDAIVVGYANGYLSYIVTPEAIPLAGYEVGRARLDGSAAAMIEQRLLALTASLY